MYLRDKLLGAARPLSGTVFCFVVDVVVVVVVGKARDMVAMNKAKRSRAMLGDMSLERKVCGYRI
jgi:hypothetical protein